uniref:Protein naked cuticle homolog n=1 Tax=Megaselia scalaris TaxID=36166 RepID=T1GRD6_MEGSC
MKKKHKQSTNLDSKNAANDKVLLDEFTCDISVESSATSQPFQFSFTFYDLDGHHGKITKDDIAGIVYTIYESIGKSMRVPCYGSKTINVKLTVSQENNIKKRKGTMSKYTTQNNGRKSNINCVNKQKSGGNVDVKNDLKTDHSTPEISNKRNNMEAFAKLNSKQI